MRRTDADTARIARCANTARQLSAQVKITDFMVLRAAEAVSNAVRISANRLYAKGHGKTSGDELRLMDGGPEQTRKPGTVNEVSTRPSKRAQPLVCKPL